MQDLSTTTETLEVEGFTPYAMTPKWVLRSGAHLSGDAVRLYGVIMSYADNDTLGAFPGLRKLSEDMGKSYASMKRYVAELERFRALKVTRRRNKQTGNYLSNHYTLVFNNPWLTDEPLPKLTHEPISKPNSLPKPNSQKTSSTPDGKAPSGTQKTCTSNPSTTFTAADAASPHSPGNLSPQQRKTLRQALMDVGRHMQAGHKFWDDSTQELWAVFIDDMEDVLGQDFELYGFADLLVNMKWTVTGKVASPYAAGVELNKILNTGFLG